MSGHGDFSKQEAREILGQRLLEARVRLEAFEQEMKTIPGLEEALVDFLNAVADVLEELK